MFCTHCGKEIPDFASFCPSCGEAQNKQTLASAGLNSSQPVIPSAATQPMPAVAKIAFPEDPSPEKQKQRGKRRGFWVQAIAGLLAVAVFVGALFLTGVLNFGDSQFDSGAKVGSIKLEGPGFASGEEALMAFVDAMKRCDVDEMVSCFAIESWVDHFRFEDYFSVSDYTPSIILNDYLPESTEFGRDVNYSIRLYNVCVDAAGPFTAAGSGCFDEGLQRHENYGSPVIYREDNLYATYDSYLMALQGGEVQETFRSMQVGTPFDITEVALHNTSISESVQESLSRQIFLHGADDIREYGVPVVVDGLSCYFALKTVCYEGRWYILRVYSNIADRYNTAEYCGFYLEFPGGD